MVENIISDVEERMKKSINKLEREFGAIRTGRATPALFDNVKVEVYNSQIPLNQVATISCPEPRLVVIQPWDRSNLGSIEKAIQKSELSLNPNSDGNLIRIQIPDLTEERRKEYAKHAKQKAEESRVALRNIRRDGNEMIKDSVVNERSLLMLGEEKQYVEITGISSKNPVLLFLPGIRQRLLCIPFPSR